MGLNIFNSNFSFEEEISKELFRKIDEELCITNNITYQYFDNYLREYPNSDYLIGMKAYFLNYNISKDSANIYLNQSLNKNQKLNNGTFSLLAKGVIENNPNIKEQFFLKSIERDTSSINKWVRLELFYFYQDQENQLKAIKYLKDALEIDPYFTNAILEQVSICIEAEDFQIATTLLTILETKYPYYPLTYLYKSDLLKVQGKFDDAIISYQKALQIDSLNIDALLGLSQIYRLQLKKYDIALQYLLDAYEIDNKNVEILVALGSVYVDMSEYDLGIKMLEKAAVSGNNYEVQIELIYAYIQKNMYEKAEDILEKTIENFGHDFRLDFFEILLAHLKNQTQKANNLINEYYKAYNNDDYNWLKQELYKWKVEIK